MRKLPARKLLCAAIAGALFLPLKGFTLGLGEIEVNSALNQKLNADIELLSATPEDTENIIVKLASRKEFSRAGLDRPYLLSDLRFKSEVVDGVPHILVSTGSPVREPFLNFLLEVDWPNGHLLREYTVLLDPPVFMTQAASTASASSAQSAATGDSSFRPSTSTTNVVPVVAPSMSASPRPEASALMPATRNESQVSTPGVMQPAIVPVIYQQQTTINQPSGSYRIKQGDTAWSLADIMRPDKSVSVEQMMIAMLRSNPESFINENVNGLKRGYILRVPDYNQIVSIQQEEAQALVREQAALWRQYQQSQTGGQPVSAMPSADLSDSESGAGDGAAITGEEDDAYLEIVSAGSGTSTMSGKDPTEMTAQELRAELSLARERVETERVEKEALQSRIDLLEQSVGKMQGMLSIEDDELSEIQSLNLPAEGDADEILAESDEQQAEQDFRDSLQDTTSDGAIDGAVEEAGEDLADETLADEVADDVVAEDMVAETTDIEATDIEESSAEDALFVDETSAVADEGLQDEMSAAESQIEPQQQIEPEIASRPPADPLSKLLSDPVLLAAAGGGLLLLVALIALIIKKRRKTAEETTFGEELPVMAMDTDALGGVADEVADEISDTEAGTSEDAADRTDEVAGDEFDSDSTMVLDSAEDTIIAESDLTAEEETEPRDDVLAEADVYLAYGIYQQAEELLEQAITDNPDRMDYRVKLAETLYASKNAEAFAEVATEIHKREGAENTPAWKKVMGMGQDLCSDNPLFQGSIVGGLDVAAPAPNVPEMDFDLGLEDDSSPDLDLSLEDQPVELPDMEDGDSSEAQDEEAAEPADELEFDLSDAGAIEETAVSDDEFSLDIDASELDIDMVDETPEAVSADVASEDDEILDIGDIDIDFGLDDDSTEESVAEAVPADDEDTAADLAGGLDSLDTDLADDENVDETSVADEPAPELVSEPELEPEPEPVSEPVVDDSSDEDDFDLSSLDDVDEISTKLDLARAYLDMGDHEGTRGILEEVIAEGSDEQKQEANELMEKLD